MTSLLKKMRGDKKGWYKVSDIVVGAEIAVSSEMGDILWDEIVSITPIGRERVYDIEVEDTHNFVGNNIFAHNTYFLRANTMLAVDGEVHAEDFVVSVPDVVSASSTISKIPPSVLTADGKGVDLYKLATYSLAGVSALAEKVGAQELRLTSLEDRVAKLESGAVSTATTSPFSLSTTSLASALESFGVLISKGFAQFVKIAADNLQVGSPAHPTGITMYDKTTGQPYCFQVDNGAATTTLGACADIVLASAQTATTVITPSTSTTDSGTTASTTITTDSANSPQATIATDSTSSPQATTTASADTTPPVVTLVGDAAMQITVGDAFTDPGATAVDDIDGDLTAKIIVSGAVDATAAGLYELTYTATDAAGNSSNVSRVVTVLAAPVAATTTTP